MKEEKALAILEGESCLEEDLSSNGSIAQLRSPPKMSWWLFKSGREDITFATNASSSQLAAYKLTRVIATLLREPVTIMNRPWLSVIMLDGLNWTFLWNRIAAPRALVLKLEWKHWPTHNALNLWWSLVIRWVSCRKAISVFKCFKWDNILPLLTGLFSPLTFQDSQVCSRVFHSVSHI